MKDVEKFDSLLAKIISQSIRIAIFEINDEEYEEYRKDKKELLRMYMED